MKIIAFLTCYFVAIASTMAGNFSRNPFLKDSVQQPLRTFYVGIGTGINNSAGVFGLSAEKGIANTASVFAAAGLSTWGTKFSAGGRYYFRFPRKAAIGLGYSYCTGAKDAKISIQVEDPNGKEVTKEVPIDLKPAASLNLTFLYFWKLGKHHRFNIEAGYAIPLQGESFTVKSNDKLTNQSKSVLHLLQPGGIVLAASFSFGLF